MSTARATPFVSLDGAVFWTPPMVAQIPQSSQTQPRRPLLPQPPSLPRPSSLPLPPPLLPPPPPSLPRPPSLPPPPSSLPPPPSSLPPPPPSSLPPPSPSLPPLPLSYSLSPLQGQPTLQLLHEIQSQHKSQRNHISAAGSGTSDDPIITPSDTISSIFNVDDENEGLILDDSRSDVRLSSIQTETTDLAHSTPDQTPCQGADVPASGTLPCHNSIPETPYECLQRHLSQDTSEGQGFATVDATEPRPVTGDATNVATSIPSSRSTPDPPTPVCASQPPTRAPLDTDDALCRGDDMSVSAAPSRHNSIPGTRDVTPQRQPSFETPQGRDHRTSGRRSEDAEACVLSEDAPPPSLGADACPFRPLGPTTRRHAHRQAMHRLVQYDDDSSNDASSDAGSESQGSKSLLPRENLQRDKDYCPSDTEAEEMSLEGGESDGEDQCPRKRRKVSRPAVSLLRDAAVSVERPCRGRPSLRSRKNAQASGILSPASSQATSEETEAMAVLASFEEWPLENASLKCITENGKTTFQVQFDWTPCTKHGHSSSTVPNQVDVPSTQTSRAKRASAPRAKYTPQENDLLIKLKEGREMLAWPEIHQRFSEAYPGRSVESLQVHYSTKVKRRKRS